MTISSVTLLHNNNLQLLLLLLPGQYSLKFWRNNFKCCLMIRSFGSPFCSRPRRVKEDLHLFCPANCFLKQKVFFSINCPWIISYFCRTGLPLARTRWAWSTFSSHCPLSSNQHRWLTWATSIIFSSEEKFGTAGNLTLQLNSYCINCIYQVISWKVT